MVISLIGYRGTGKTTVAPLLAAKLGWDWIDADVAVEQLAGRTIRDIFAADGEPVFRELERQTLVGLLGRTELVLAAGGGAILRADTRSDLRRAGPVVWLQASAATLAARLAADPATASQRPPLTAAGGLDEIRRVLDQREPLYRETATITVTTENRTAAEIAAEILSRL